MMQVEHKTLSEVIQSFHAWEQDHQPYDRVCRLHSFQFVPEGQSIKLVPLQGETPGAMGQLTLEPHALDQFLGRLDYNKRLFQKLPSKLNMMNLNWLLQHEAYDQEALLRIQDGTRVRAVMSSRFEVFDNLELLTMLEPHYGDGTVRWEFNDELTFHLSISFPSKAEEIKLGDVVERGVHVSNSEVGLRSIIIAGYIYRLVCNNGAITEGDGGGFFRFRHMGHHERIKAFVEDALRNVMLETDNVIARYRQALETEIERPTDFIEKLAADHGLTRTEFKAILDSLIEAGGGNALYDVSQAISATANKVNGQKAYELRRLAVDIL